MIYRSVRKRLVPNIRIGSRNYSNSHGDIETFKKQQTEYKFGLFKDIESAKRNVYFSEHKEHAIKLKKHPSLAGLRPNSPEYMYELYQLERKGQVDYKRQRKIHEFTERIKAIGAGALALVGIISVYQVVMNYPYIKAHLNGKWNFNWDDSSIQNNNDPKINTHTIENLTERFNSEIDDEFASSLKRSDTTPGIYLFGSINHKRLPSRIPGFDFKYFKDVLVTDDLVTAIDERGTIFKYTHAMKQPVKIVAPVRMSLVLFSGGKLYYLSSNKKDLYCGEKTAPIESSGWFRKTLNSSMFKIPMDGLCRGERINKIVSGDNHLLILTSKGRLFGVNTTADYTNKGQYCLPIYSPSIKNEEIPVDSAFELKNLNYELVGSGDQKILQPRTFTDVGAGKYYNVAVDSNKNIWNWGDNAYSQCGIESTAVGAIQGVPRLVFSINDLGKFAKYSLPDQGANGQFDVAAVSCSNETSLLKLTYRNFTDPSYNQDMLLTFGNGLKGQLGISRYLHKTGQPLVIKSLVGLKEYDVVRKKTFNVGIKDIITGGDHSFVVLNNAGTRKDVLVFGDNMSGQFGNGKAVKSSKPLHIPKLLEPSDFEGSKTQLVRRVNDENTNRFQLLESSISGQSIEQVLAAGEKSSAIFYRKIV